MAISRPNEAFARTVLPETVEPVHAVIPLSSLENDVLFEIVEPLKPAIPYAALLDAVFPEMIEPAPQWMPVPNAVPNSPVCPKIPFSKDVLSETVEKSPVQIPARFHRARRFTTEA